MNLILLNRTFPNFLMELNAQGEEDRECDDIGLDGTTQDILGA